MGIDSIAFHTLAVDSTLIGKHRGFFKYSPPPAEFANVICFRYHEQPQDDLLTTNLYQD